MSCRVRPAHPDDREAVRALFQAYQALPGIGLCFQSFQQELDSLPGAYAPPGGVILLGEIAGAPVGVVALRPLGPDIAEMKRLFVLPEHQRTGLGRELALALLKEARAKGYRKLRLDTLPVMQKAISLYRQLGFQEIEPYAADPVPGALCFELDLGAP